MAPAPYTISRDIVVARKADSILPLLLDFRRWRDWSPWDSAGDDRLQRTYSGAKSGLGAHYAWRGDRKAGAGSMTITGVDKGRVALDLVFIKPWKAKNKVEFTLAPEGKGTRVTWTMHGEHRGLSKYVAKIVPMHKIVGKDFERGLESLKERAEKKR